MILYFPRHVGPLCKKPNYKSQRMHLLSKILMYIITSVLQVVNKQEFLKRVYGLITPQLVKELFLRLFFICKIHFLRTFFSGAFTMVWNLQQTHVRLPVYHSKFSIRCAAYHIDAVYPSVDVNGKKRQGSTCLEIRIIEVM